MRVLVLLSVAGMISAQTRPERAHTLEQLQKAGPGAGNLQTAIAMLRDADDAVRAMAADTLGSFGAGAQAAVRPLIGCLPDPSDHVRSRCAYNLGRIGPVAAEAVPFLIPMLSDPSDDTRWMTLAGLAGIGPAAAEGIGAVLSCVDDRNANIRAAALDALSRLAPALDGILPLLGPAQLDSSPDVRRAAAGALSHWAAAGPIPAALLRSFLRDPDYTVASAAMGAIFRMPQRDAGGFVSDLVALLNNTAGHFSTRAAAADALGAVGDPALVAVPDLRRALHDNHDSVRNAASRALRALRASTESANPGVQVSLQANGPTVGNKPAIEDVVKRLSSDNAGVRISALQQMAIFEEHVSAYAAALLSRFNEGGLEEKRAAIRVMGHMRTNTVAVGPALLEQLDNENLRMDILQAIGSMGPDAAPAAPKLIPLLKSRDKQLAGAAISAIGGIGPRASIAAAPLAELLENPDEEVRLQVLYALNHLFSGASAALPAMIRTLDDSSSRVRGDSAYAIGQVFAGHRSHVELPAAAALKLTALLKDGDAGAREHAAYALGWALPVGDRVIDGLTASLADGSHQVRAQAARSLGICTKPESIPALVKALGDPSSEVRTAAAWGLSHFGAAANSAVPALNRAASDADLEVRRAVRQAIERIQR